MTKRINFTADATSTIIGEAPKARVRIKDGQVQVRFTDRTSLVNLPKDETVKDLTIKGSGRRLSIPANMSETLAIGETVALVPAKYGWFTIAQGAHSVLNGVAGRVSS